MCGQGLEPKLEWNTAALTTPQILNQGENAKNTLAYLHLSLKFNGKKFYNIGHKLWHEKTVRYKTMPKNILRP